MKQHERLNDQATASDLKAFSGNCRQLSLSGLSLRPANLPDLARAAGKYFPIAKPAAFQRLTKNARRLLPNSRKGAPGAGL